MCKSVAILAPLLLSLGLVSVSHGALYRWVDEDGNVHYSDSVPPDQIRSGHTELSEQGVRVNSVPPVRSPEEVQKEMELERMRTQQQELLEKQRSADRDFLKAFRSEDDILMARDGKIAQFDVMIDVTRTKALSQQRRMARLLARAANLERAGEPTPQHLSDNITQAERAIRDAYATIVDREEQKRSIRNSFAQDLARFRQLKNLPTSESLVQTQDRRPILHNIVTCPDPGECDRLWEKAKEYANRHSTTPVQTSSAAIFITAPPANEQDVSLILTRINDKEGPGAFLFLDLHCERSARGKEMCQGQDAQDIIEGFGPALAGKDAPGA